MNAREVRLRCIEAVAGTGVREVHRLIRDAKELEDWVLKAGELDGPAEIPEPDKAQRPPKKAA